MDHSLFPHYRLLTSSRPAPAFMDLTGPTLSSSTWTFYLILLFDVDYHLCDREASEQSKRESTRNIVS